MLPLFVSEYMNMIVCICFYLIELSNKKEDVSLDTPSYLN